MNPDHAPIIIAQEKGFFTDEGLEVEVIAPADPADPPKLVAAGKADYAITYQPQLHRHQVQGLPLKYIGTLIATPLNCLMVKADGPIQKIADLKGKRSAIRCRVSKPHWSAPCWPMPGWALTMSR